MNKKVDSVCTACFIQSLTFHDFQHGLHPVHLTLHASATPVAERGIRHVTPDRMTRDQATTFRPSDLPIGQTTTIRRYLLIYVNFN